MSFSRRKIDQSLEKRFIIGLIVNDRFIRESRQIYKSEYISSQPVNTIAQWCYKYYEDYEQAPKQHINDLFDAKESKLDESLSGFIETLLQQLEDEWEHADKFNVDFLLNEVETYFKSKSLLALSASIRECVSTGNIIEAEALQSQYNMVQLVKGGGIDPFSDETAIEEALIESDAEPLFKIPGALGEIMNPQFVRAGFIALIGPEKRGKSFWIDELAIRAYRNRCNVVLFECGDMTKNQRIARIHSYLAKKPLAKFYRSDKPIKIPIPDCLKNQDNSCNEKERTGSIGCLDKNGNFMSIGDAETAGYMPCNKCKLIQGTLWWKFEDVKPLSIQEAIENGKKFMGRARGRRFKLSVHENSSLNVKKADAQLEVWKNTEGFVADVILFDYAGIMAPEDSRKEHRNQVNDTWKAMRALSQKWQACVVTVDQTDADSYDKENIGLRNFSEDKRKYGHVTAMYSLNQTDIERKQGIMRVGELVVRQGATDATRKVYVLECRQVGRINLGSYF